MKETTSRYLPTSKQANHQQQCKKKLGRTDGRTDGRTHIQGTSFAVVFSKGATNGQNKTTVAVTEAAAAAAAAVALATTIQLDRLLTLHA